MKQEKLYLMVASSSTAEVTEEWIRQIKESFPVWMSCAIICRWGCPVILIGRVGNCLL